MPTPELTLLAVDDQPDNLISLQALLEDALPAARLLTATSGRKALDLAAAEDPDAILLDVVMPEMDGFEVCRRLKADARTKDIPVVFLTALRADREHRVRALQEGAEAFLRKPVEETELTAQVRAMAKIKAAAIMKRDQRTQLEALVAERTREIEQGRAAALNLLEDLRVEQEERKLAMDRAEHLTRVLRAIRNVNQLITHEKDCDSLLRRSCEILVSTRGYHSAWVVLRGEDGKAQTVAECGIGDDFAPLRQAMERDDWPDCCRQVWERPDHIAAIYDTDRNCKACSLSRTYRDTAALAGALRHGGRDYGVLVVALPKGLAEEAEERSLFRELVGDVAYALHSMELARERTEALEASRSSEERFRLAVENAPDAIFVQTQYCFAHLNPAAVRCFGAESADQLLGQPVMDRFEPRLHGVVRERIRLLNEEKIAAPQVEQIYLKMDGSPFDVEVAAVPIHWNGQNGALVFFRDITERKRQQEALRRSEDRFRRAIGYAPFPAMIHAEDGEVVMINAEWTRVTGYGHDEIPTIEAWTERAYGALQGTVRAVIDRLYATTGRTDEGDFEIRCRDGSTRVWTFSSTPIGADETGRRLVLSMAVDTTERKRAEERLKASKEYLDRIINAIGDPVFVKDEQFRFTLVNDALCALLGKTRDEIVGRTGLEFLPPDQMDHFLEVDRKVLSSGAENLCRESLAAHDGKAHTIVTKKTRYVDGQGARFIVGTIRDVTQHEKLEEQLRMSQKMEAIGSLAGGVAHDFNNLLSVILGNVGFAMEALRTEDPIRGDLVEVKSAAERAAALTRQLLAFSRKQILQPVPLSLNQIAAAMEKMLRRILGEDLDYVQVLAPDLGMVLADPGQIEQVLMNLVVNARDAMPEGGKLTIETFNVDIDEDHAARHLAVTPGPYVLLAVTDTGCGMDSQTRARLFEPFFTTKEKGKGTGLGLSTVYGIVKQSGGNIWVYSEPGRGTTFKIYLPRELETTVAVTHNPGLLTRATGTETVLVVEDEEALREVARRSLSAAGFTVLTAADGAEALEIAARHAGEIQLLLTDVVMPKMSGRALALELVKTRPAIQVVYMSGYTDNAIVHHGVLDAGTQFIGKPFTGAELARKVRAVLDGPSTGPR